MLSIPPDPIHNPLYAKAHSAFTARLALTLPYRGSSPVEGQPFPLLFHAGWDADVL